MDFTNIRCLNKKQKTGIKSIEICMMLLAVLILVSTLGFAAEPEEKVIDRTGTIDQIRDNDVAVDDCNFKLSPDVKFYTNSKMNTYANRSRFKKGTHVGFQIDNHGLVISMWLQSK